MDAILAILTVLVDEHPNRNSRHVESIQEVLDAVLRVMINIMRLLKLQYALSHGLYYVRMSVSNFDQIAAEVL